MKLKINCHIDNKVTTKEVALPDKKLLDIQNTFKHQVEDSKKKQIPRKSKYPIKIDE